LPAFVVVIGGQMEEGSLDKVTKAASRRVGATKITAQKAQGKLLGQFLGGIRVMDRAQQVAVDGSLIPFQNRPPRCRRRIRRAVVRLVQCRPACRDPAEPLDQGLRIHGSNLGEMNRSSLE